MLTVEHIGVRLVLALALGCVIGAEREYRDKSAGFRTMALICLGSCLFTMVSIMLSNGTTDRIASTVVTGIGFIGAGVIFKSEQGVQGLTTAAGIWATAAVGMAIGSGFYILGSLACFLVLCVLSLFHLIESRLEIMNKERVYKIRTNYEEGVFERYESIMSDLRLRFKQMKRTRSAGEVTLSWKVKGSNKHHDEFILKMLRDKNIREFEF